MGLGDSLTGEELSAAAADRALWDFPISWAFRAPSLLLFKSLA